MHIVRATLIKLATDDGLCTFEERVQLGQTYLVDLDTITRGQTMIHRHDNGQCEAHVKDIIDVAGTRNWLPLECLRLEA
jgi:hypothetical protein